MEQWCCSYSLGLILDTWVTPHNGSAGVCRQQILLIKCLCSVSSSLTFMLPKCGKKACAFQNNKNQIEKIFLAKFYKAAVLKYCIDRPHLTWISIYTVSNGAIAVLVTFCNISLTRTFNAMQRISG